ncbi:MAG: SMC family ATPase [Oscillospiraceae bacterium]|nr:SMC family ATPase [Oscillospiraceae bacterium]
MLPIKLKMQAFASYADAVEIDFEKLSSLFLIHGATGSGKTAILDAMMYALYGKSSGDGRSVFRCRLPGAENIPTEVEFVFRSGGRLYKFTRTIRITRSKKEESRQDCFVYEEAEEQFRAIFENPTLTKVNDEARRITGLTADQFRQVVILPQGQFERLLTSKSEDKEATLSTLFSADKYTKISARLSEKAAAMKSGIESDETALRAVLAAESTDSIDGLNREAERLEEEKAKLVPMARQAEKALSEIRDRLTAAEVAAEKFSALENAVKREAELDKLAERISFVKSALAKNAEAGRIRHEYAEAASAAETLEVRRKQLETARFYAADSEKYYAVMTEKTKAVAEGEKLYKERLSELAVLSGLSEVYDRISVAESRRSRLARELAEVERSGLLLAEAEKKTASDLGKLEAEQSEIRERYSAVLPDLMSRKKALESGAEAEKKLLVYDRALDEIRNNVAKLKNEAALLDKSRSEAEKNYDRLYADFIANTAAELSSALKEGTPCPVCGSTVHPCPAVNSGNTVTAEAVKSAKTAFESAYKAASDKHNEAAAQEARIPAAEEHIGNMQKIISDCGYSADELKAVTEKLEEAQKKNALLPQIGEHISQLSAQHEDLKNKINEAAQRKSQLQSEASAANAEAETLKNQLDKRFPDVASYKAGVAEIKAEIEKFEKEKSVFDEAMKIAENNKIKTAEALSKAEEEVLAAQKNCDNANKNFSLRLSQAGFPSAEDYKKALLSDDIAAEYASEAERYDLERHAVAEQVKQLRGELEGREKPELDLLRKEAEEAQKSFGEITAGLSAVSQRCERLKKLAEDCAVRFAESEKRREKYDKLSAFAKFMVGSKGISFTRYILGIILGLVVEEANSILAGVHGGRFRLCVKTDLAANSKQGLDLEVETLTADGCARYGVKDLSGGEKFLISLALSLGLSAVAQSRSGGIKIEAMFIDEGFGSLDTGLLREAVGILCGLTSERSTIGIISHVSELKSVIPCGISVAKDKDGCSRILSTV